MKLGFSTGNRRGICCIAITERTDRFLNFRWIGRDGLQIVQFFNQEDPKMAVRMLRQMADDIEREIGRKRQ